MIAPWNKFTKKSTVEVIDKKPTQKDKPSHRSPYTEGQLLSFSRVGFPKTVQRYMVNNTNSMEPWIDAGDVVLVLPTKDLHVGNVYVYRLGTMLVIHRLTKIKGDVLTFRGDNNFRDDLPVRKEQIVGLVFGVLWGTKKDSD